VRRYDLRREDFVRDQRIEGVTVDRRALRSGLDRCASKELPEHARTSEKALDIPSTNDLKILS
jgi:hypothetical protein